MMADDATKAGGLWQPRDTVDGSHPMEGAAAERPRSAQDLVNESSVSFHRMTILSYVLGSLAFLVLLASVLLAVLSGPA